MGRWNKGKSVQSPTAQSQTHASAAAKDAIDNEDGFWEVSAVSPGAAKEKCTSPSSEAKVESDITQQNQRISHRDLASVETLARQDSELVALEAMYPDVFEEGNINSSEMRAAILRFTTSDGSTLRLRVELPNTYPAKEPPSFSVLQLPSSAPAAEGDQLLQDLEEALVAGALFYGDNECLVDVVHWLLAEGVPTLEDRMRAKAAAGNKTAKKGKNVQKCQSGSLEMQRVSYWFASVGPKGDRIGNLQSEFPQVTGVIAINARPSLGVFEGPRATMDCFVKELRAQGNNRGQLGLSEKASEIVSFKDELGAANWRKFDKLLRVSLDEAKQMITERDLMQPFSH